MKKEILYRVMIGIALFLLCCFTVALKACGKEPEDSIFGSSDETDGLIRGDLIESASEIQSIVIYLTGEVVSPGIVTLPEGSRLYEAVQLSGGFTEDADTRLVNLAMPLTDGAHIHIPKIGETAELHENNDGKININTASVEELMTISGIGEAKAKSIVSYREKHGYFRTIDSIMEVSGIGQSLFEQIRE